MSRPNPEIPSLPQASPILALLRELITRRSLTPEDAGCCELIAGRLQPLGFICEYLNAGGVTNLWAVRDQGAPLVVLAGHTDVVPPGPRERWNSDPFVPTLRDGWLYGRGAADMKSGLAAMVCATERLLTRREPRASLAFLITSDEEGHARHGTRHACEVLRARGVQPQYALIGEASSLERLGDRIVIGRRGSLGCDLRVFGKQGHVAYPQRADNPIHRLAPMLTELIATHWDDGTEHFPPTSLQISNFNAGTGANNVIPGHADLVFNFRYCPASTAASLRQRVDAVLDHHLARYDADWWHSGEPFYTAPGLLVGAARGAVRAVTGLDPELSTGGGTSDGRFLAPLGAQVIEVGPVNASIHQVDERIEIADLERLCEIYLHLLLTLV
ncbi:MAG: succinyl-diaminopimelate desuccinylase [Gammaproteobacteria bacterium]|nr:succinyl-diaminopimelate desuccinylase [Gammaproteobacteria bacterium]